jgi:hypothetical protein
VTEEFLFMSMQVFKNVQSHGQSQRTLKSLPLAFIDHPRRAHASANRRSSAVNTANYHIEVGLRRLPVYTPLGKQEAYAVRSKL